MKNTLNVAIALLRSPHARRIVCHHLMPSPLEAEALYNTLPLAAFAVVCSLLMVPLGYLLRYIL